jgi:hypothetical protein
MRFKVVVQSGFYNPRDLPIAPNDNKPFNIETVSYNLAEFE